jgi:GTP cyclohydrolase I
MRPIDDKNDKTLGLKVENHLKSLNVHTPMSYLYDATEEEKIAAIERHFTSIMQVLGLDLEDDSLSETPKRVAKMFVKEIFWGLDPANFPKCTTIENKMKYDEMVFERNISIKSMCEHHFLPIYGKAHIAYIPNSKVLGLSKLNRIVEYFARRPQVQERLAEQVHAALCYILETENVAVVLEGEHFCVKMRGVEDGESDTITSKISGSFKQPAVRAELFSLLKL